MTAAARTATQVRGSTCDPAITVAPPPVAYRSPDQWDREYLLDVVAASSRDAYDLCGHSDLVRAICDDYGIVHADADMYRTQRDGARLQINKLDAVTGHNLKLRDDIATERNLHQATILNLEVARDELADAMTQLMAERAERVRLQGLAAKLSAQLAETSQRLIDVSFEHATHAIAKLQAERQSSQCMLFDTSDTTVVDVVIP